MRIRTNITVDVQRMTKSTDEYGDVLRAWGNAPALVWAQDKNGVYLQDKNGQYLYYEDASSEYTNVAMAVTQLRAEKRLSETNVEFTATHRFYANEIINIRESDRINWDGRYYYVWNVNNPQGRDEFLQIDTQYYPRKR